MSSPSDQENDLLKPNGLVNPIDTDYQVGQDNVVVKVGPFGLDIHNRVFAISGLLIVLFVAITLIFREQAEPLFSSVRDWLTSNLDWFFIGAANIFVILCLVLIFTPLGKVRLGGTEADPDFSYIGWFSHVVCRWYGHWSYVLRRFRAHRAF